MAGSGPPRDSLKNQGNLLGFGILPRRSERPLASYLKSASISELLALYKSNFRDIDAVVAESMAAARATAQQLAHLLGREIEDCDILEVGSGQRSAFKYLLGARNRYVGVDIEPAPTGNLVPDLVQDIRQRGMSRAVKNAIKNLSGLSRKFDRTMKAAVGAESFDISFFEMDAERLAFPDDSFDIVISHNVFEHLPNPVAVMREISRVLRAGGVAHIHTHLYTSDSGAHDPRVYSGDRAHLPYWAHLRSETARLVASNCYVNKLRLAEYIEGFEAPWPGSESTPLPSSEELKVQLRALRKIGELEEFSDLELVTNVLRTVWKKP